VIGQLFVAFATSVHTAVSTSVTSMLIADSIALMLNTLFAYNSVDVGSIRVIVDSSNAIPI
jgi:hypothetical protein